MPPAANPNPDRARRAASFADIERWESDTDSGGSDEEVDFKEGNNLSNTQVLASWLSACSLSTDAHRDLRVV